MPSLVVQGLRLHASHAGVGADSIPGQGTKIPTCQCWEAKQETNLREM